MKIQIINSLSQETQEKKPTDEMYSLLQRVYIVPQPSIHIIEELFNFTHMETSTIIECYNNL